MTFENLFSIGASIRVAFGIIFALFIVCFVAIVIEETFLGGRRRRKAIKNARKPLMEGEMAKSPSADDASLHSN